MFKNAGKKRGQRVVKRIKLPQEELLEGQKLKDVKPRYLEISKPKDNSGNQNNS